jgi:hypothetical protein
LVPAISLPLPFIFIFLSIPTAPFLSFVFLLVLFICDRLLLSLFKPSFLIPMPLSLLVPPLLPLDPQLIALFVTMFQLGQVTRLRLSIFAQRKQQSPPLHSSYFPSLAYPFSIPL